MVRTQETFLQGWKLLPQAFTHQPFDPMSLHRDERFHGYGKCCTHSRRHAVGDEKYAANELSIESAAVTIQPVEFSAPPERLPACHLAFVTDSQFVTPFCPTPGKNFSSRLRCHPRTEPVRIPAFALVWLKCTLHQSTHPSTVIERRCSSKKMRVAPCRAILPEQLWLTIP